MANVHVILVVGSKRKKTKTIYQLTQRQTKTFICLQRMHQNKSYLKFDKQIKKPWIYKVVAHKVLLTVYNGIQK
jgi:transcription elongation factor Elf1